MKNSTPNGSVFAVSIGRGRATTSYRRVALELDGWGAEALTSELERLSGAEWVWSAHTWRDDARGKDAWEAAACLAVDLDYGDDTGTHDFVSDDVRARFDEALRALPFELAHGEVLAHHTPRGARLVLLLDAPVTDRTVFARAATSTNALLTRWLAGAGLLGGERRAGYTVDFKALLDLARVLYAPNATVEGERVPRRAVFSIHGARDGRIVAAELAALAPSVAVADHKPPTEHRPHPLWPAVEAALLKTPKARKAEGKGVAVRCPIHGADENPSAMVFASGVLTCLASGCDANSGKPLDAWARSPAGAELLGDELAQLVTKAPMPAGRVRGDTLRPFWRTVGEWGWTREPAPPMRWLLTVPPSRSYRDTRHVLARGTVGMLAAGGGVGKSMALMQLAVAVATDTAWLVGDAEGEFAGFLTHAEGGKVLLALGEENAAKAHRRMDVLTAHLTPEERTLLEQRLVVLPLEAVPVGLMADRASSGAEAHAGDTAAELEQLLMEGGPWALVILDPLSRFAGMETEIDNASATRFVQVLERFTKAPGEPTVLVSHHTGQNARQEGLHDATAARGATALTDGVRWVATLIREKPSGEVEERVAPLLSMAVTKNNYGMELWPFWLARGEGGSLRCATRAEIDAFKRKSAAAKKKASEATRAPDWGEP